MATVVNKKFIGFDARFTDGKDYNKMSAIYKVVDSDGFAHTGVLISAVTHNLGVDVDINTAIEGVINAPRVFC